MRYQLTNKLTFGRYKGYTVQEIYSGWATPSEQFYQQFIRHRLQGEVLYDTWDNSNKSILKVNGLEFLTGNDLRIDYEATPDITPAFVLNYFNVTLFAVEHYPLKAYYESANDFIVTHNKTNSDKFGLFADPQYLFWCLIKVDRFFLSHQNFETLLQMDCTVFEGIVLSPKANNVFTFSSRLSKGRSKGNAKAKVSNANKDNAAMSQSFVGEDPWKPSYEVYGGAYGYDDDTIDYAFDGDPENYWNID